MTLVSAGMMMIAMQRIIINWRGVVSGVVSLIVDSMIASTVESEHKVEIINNRNICSLARR